MLALAVGRAGMCQDRWALLSPWWAAMEGVGLSLGSPARHPRDAATSLLNPPGSSLNSAPPSLGVVAQEGPSVAAPCAETPPCGPNWHVSPRKAARYQCAAGFPAAVPAPHLSLVLSSPHRSGSSRHEPSGREPGQHFGGPPPLISPKPQHHPVTTSLWNPVSLMESPPEPPRRLPEPHALHGHPAPFEPSRQGIPLVKVERVFCPEKLEEGARKRDALEKYPSAREPGAPEHGSFTHAPFLAELEKSTQSILSQQRPPAAPFVEATKPSSPYRPPPPRAQDPMYIYDEFVQQHRRLVSKLDLEERRRREAREKGETLGLHRTEEHPPNRHTGTGIWWWRGRLVGLLGMPAACDANAPTSQAAR